MTIERSQILNFEAIKYNASIMFTQTALFYNNILTLKIHFYYRELEFLYRSNDNSYHVLNFNKHLAKKYVDTFILNNNNEDLIVNIFQIDIDDFDDFNDSNVENRSISYGAFYEETIRF